MTSSGQKEDKDREEITDGRDHPDWVAEEREKFERMDRYDESGYWRHFR